MKFKMRSVLLPLVVLMFICITSSVGKGSPEHDKLDDKAVNRKLERDADELDDNDDEDIEISDEEFDFDDEEKEKLKDYVNRAIEDESGGKFAIDKLERKMKNHIMTDIGKDLQAAHMNKGRKQAWFGRRRRRRWITDIPNYVCCAKRWICCGLFKKRDEMKH